MQLQKSKLNAADIEVIKTIVNEAVGKAVEDLGNIIKDFMQQSAEQFAEFQRKWDQHDHLIKTHTKQINRHEYLLQEHSTALIHINNQLRLLSPAKSDTI